MAHGGLAQAGKVKNATPKVAKQERTEKRKTGRAKKREQYGRFMERLQTGSRDGPNKQQRGKLG